GTRLLSGLHSFPTRRSSDLVGANVLFGNPPSVAARPDAAEINAQLSRQPTHGRPCRGGRVTIARLIGKGGSRFARGRFLCGCWRSEEHTSELQSRENLVCRL